MCGRHAKRDQDDKVMLDYLLAVGTNLFLHLRDSGSEIGKMN